MQTLLVAGCDFLTLLPCNATIKTCYIHSNVCQNTDIIFSGFGPAWTFIFVLYPVQNATRCYETPTGTMTSECTSPAPNVTTNNVTFELSIVSRQGISDDNVTFATLPPNNTASSATLKLTSCPAFTPLTAILSIYGTGFMASNFVFIIGDCLIQTTTAGLLASTALESLVLLDVQFVGPQIGVIVLAIAASVKMNFCTVITNASALLPFTGGVLLALKGCGNICNVFSNTTSLLTQYVIFDAATPNIHTDGIPFNISTIIPFTVMTSRMPTSVPSPPPVSCPDNRGIQIAIVSIMAVLLLIIIIAIIRRHYSERAREKIN